MVCPRLTVSLSHLQQDGLLQHDGERLVLLVLLVVDDLHIQQLPASGKGQGTRRGWRQTEMDDFHLFALFGKQQLLVDMSQPAGCIC